MEARLPSSFLMWIPEYLNLLRDSSVSAPNRHMTWGHKNTNFLNVSELCGNSPTLLICHVDSGEPKLVATFLHLSPERPQNLRSEEHELFLTSRNCVEAHPPSSFLMWIPEYLNLLPFRPRTDALLKVINKNTNFFERVRIAWKLTHPPHFSLGFWNA